MKKVYFATMVIFLSIVSLFSALSLQAQNNCDGILVSYSIQTNNPFNSTISIVDSNGNLVIATDGLATSGSVCLTAQCYTVYLTTDTTGTALGSQNFLFVTLYSMNGYSFGGGTGSDGSGIIQMCLESSVLGCTDPSALNYNPAANQNDGSCTYANIGGSCADPLTMVCGQTYTGSTTGIPNDNITSGANLGCGSNFSDSQVWYSYTASESGLVTLSACGSAYDTYLKVFTGSCGSLQCVGYNDDSGSTCIGVPNGDVFDSNMSFNAIAGTTYLVRMGGFASANGAYSLSISCSTIYGCSDALACNYLPNAVDDGSCDYTSCTGCTDPNALNYDYTAIIDDGSCSYCDGNGSSLAQMYVCTFSNGDQLQIQILDSQGNEVINVGGLNSGSITYYDLCLSAGECYTAIMTNTAGPFGWYSGYFWINVNGIQIINDYLDNGFQTQSAIFSIDGTCAPTYGCTDPNANNYNPDADTDDGSCYFLEDCTDGTQVAAVVTANIYGNEMSWHIVDANGNILLAGGGLANYSSATLSICLPDGCYSLIMQDSFGDGWNGGSIVLYENGVEIISTTISYGNLNEVAFGINADGCSTITPSGCTNPSADNYNPAAIIDDGSCVISGCTDPSAINYNQAANTDDGSCELCNGPGSALANLYVCTFSNGNQVQLQILDDQGNEVILVNGLNSGSIFNTYVCLQAGVCYTAVMTNTDGPFGWYNGYFWINANGWQVINTQLNAGQQTASVQFSIDGTCGPVVTPGCTDLNASNYNAEATVNDGSCIYPTYGCTNPIAYNYNPLATIDDGSCISADGCNENIVSFYILGSVFPNEMSYSVFDGNGNYVVSGQGNSISYGCLGDGCYTIMMYDSFGDGWDSGVLYVTVNGNTIGQMSLSTGNYGSGVFGVNSSDCTPEVSGCTDPSAINFNAAANTDDGSCLYVDDCTDNLVTIIISTQNWGSEISWSLNDDQGNSVASGSGYSSWNTNTTYACLPSGCYTMEMNDSWGDGWNGGYYMIIGDNAYSEGSLFYGSNNTDVVSVNSNCTDVAGCMDQDALNYNPFATFDDGSCTYNNNGGIDPGNFIGMNIELNLYPNPTTGGMILDAGNLSAVDAIRITIRGLDGKMVNDVTIMNEMPSRKINLDVSNCAAGYYLMTVQNGERAKVMPFIKE